MKIRDSEIAVSCHCGVKTAIEIRGKRSRIDKKVVIVTAR